MKTIRRGSTSNGTPYTIFLVDGEIADLNQNAVARETHGRCIRYYTVDTKQTVWVTHGHADGTIDNEVFISCIGKPTDPVVACYPGRCAKKYPDLNFVIAHCDESVSTQLVGAHQTGIAALLVIKASVDDDERTELIDTSFEMLDDYLKRGQ